MFPGCLKSESLPNAACVVLRWRGRFGELIVHITIFCYIPSDHHIYLLYVTGNLVDFIHCHGSRARSWPQGEKE